MSQIPNTRFLFRYGGKNHKCGLIIKCSITFLFFQTHSIPVSIKHRLAVVNTRYGRSVEVKQKIALNRSICDKRFERPRALQNSNTICSTCEKAVTNTFRIDNQQRCATSEIIDYGKGLVFPPNSVQLSISDHHLILHVQNGFVGFSGSPYTNNQFLVYNFDAHLISCSKNERNHNRDQQTSAVLSDHQEYYKLFSTLQDDKLVIIQM